MSKGEKWADAFGQASERINEWRGKHPQASFTDIENTVDKQLAKVRAAMIQDLALESELRAFNQLPVGKRPKCPGCGKPLTANGKQSRQLITTHEQVVKLERSKGYCRRCRVSFFPPG
jgi:hypothetical protein